MWSKWAIWAKWASWPSESILSPTGSSLGGNMNVYISVNTFCVSELTLVLEKYCLSKRRLTLSIVFSVVKSCDKL
jgi:hypothetical protein